MIYFNCDYLEGAHPRILEAFEKTNGIQQPGYGEDEYSQKAIEAIKKHLKKDQRVKFIHGGTATNALVIATLLKPYEGVVSVDSGHINVHETGAVEATGHKVISLKGKDGKIQSRDLDQLFREHEESPTRIHEVRPAMVYLSQPTEYGTVYTGEELDEIRKICQYWDRPLFIDGARLAYLPRDNSLEKIAEVADIFYIGGTKCGFLLGEALVYNKIYEEDLSYMIKTMGCLMAKGRVLGIQFFEMFKDNLYFELGQKARQQTLELAEDIQEKGYTIEMPVDANLIFMRCPLEKYEELQQQFVFDVDRREKDDIIIRIAISWATSDDTILQLKKAL
ncbi:MAG: beta-eliminating lyase-related protein [Tissierellia bacterium]|nr:beta-eliminating lyase-related protein [Tissierellia bacterium]